MIAQSIAARKQQRYSTALSTSEAIARLDELMRRTWPRYLRQLRGPVAPTAQSVAASLGRLPAIDSDTDLELLRIRLDLIVSPLKLAPPVPTKPLDPDARVRLQGALYDRVTQISATLEWSNGIEDPRGFTPLIMKITTLMEQTIALMAAWGTSRPKARRRRPSPPLVVHC